MDSNSAAGAEVVGLILSLAFIAFLLWPYYHILRKAGYSGWYCLLALIPLVNIIALFTFAFSDWPIEQRARGDGMRVCPYCKTTIPLTAVVCRYCQRESSPPPTPKQPMRIEAPRPGERPCLSPTREHRWMIDPDNVQRERCAYLPCSISRSRVVEEKVR